LSGCAWVIEKPYTVVGVNARKCNDNSDTVDGQNPAPPRMMIIPLFMGF